MALTVFVEAGFLLGLGALPLVLGGRRPVDASEEELVLVAPAVVHVLVAAVALALGFMLVVVVVLPVGDALGDEVGNLLEEVQLQGLLLVLGADVELELLVRGRLLRRRVVPLDDARVPRVVFAAVHGLGELRKAGGVDGPVSVLLLVAENLHLVLHDLAVRVEVLVL